MKNATPGVVIFTGDKERLARFYSVMTGLPIVASDDSVTVLASGEFDLVIHALPAEPPGGLHAVREEAYIKPFFPVASLSEARRQAQALGGHLDAAGKEWSARGFTACEAIDPDGNVIQFRQQTT